MMCIYSNIWGKYVVKAKLAQLDLEELEEAYKLEYTGYSVVLYALGEIDV